MRYFTVVLALGLAGCVTSGDRRIADDAVVAQVQAGQTKDQVKALLGDPTSVSTGLATGDIWVYIYSHAQTTAASYVPVVGIFAGGATATSSSLAVTFDKDGRVASVQRTKTNTDSQLGH